MSKTPKTDALRAMREQRWASDKRKADKRRIVRHPSMAAAIKKKRKK
jgi:hypothetical protein